VDIAAIVEIEMHRPWMGPSTKRPPRISMSECKTMAPVGGEEAEMISRTFARSGSLEYT
jgi:hypothetical protein